MKESIKKVRNNLKESVVNESCGVWCLFFVDNMKGWYKIYMLI